MAQNKDWVADAETLLEENLSETKSVEYALCKQAIEDKRCENGSLSLFEVSDF